jgi:hypothetical protein
MLEASLFARHVPDSDSRRLLSKEEISWTQADGGQGTVSSYRAGGVCENGRCCGQEQRTGPWKAACLVVAALLK